MADIFISHSSQDADTAHALAERCEAAGLSVFLDKKAIRPGEDWLDRLDAELEECEAVWVLASPRAMQSGMVQQEIGAARAHKADIIPIVWDMPPEDLPHDLQRRQAVVLTGETPEGIEHQVSQLIANAVRAKKWRSATFIDAFVTHVGDRHHWADHGGEGWVVDSKWDPAFPSFSGCDTREEAVGWYWDLYTERAQALAEAMDNFRIFPYEDLHTFEGRKRILVFAGLVPQPESVEV